MGTLGNPFFFLFDAVDIVEGDYSSPSIFPSCLCFESQG